MGTILSASKPHCHSRLSKPILKIQSIYRKNILGKQLSQARYFKYVFRLLHAPKFQIFSTKLNLMVKVVKLFTGVLWKSCSNEFYRETPMQESRNPPVILPNVSKRFSCKHLWVIASAKYPFLLCPPQPQKMCPSTLVILNIFETNTVNCLQTTLYESSRPTVSCD